MKSTYISFCTVAMNRLHHVQKTLPRNMEDNRDYENLEFVLLDYNSSDGLEDWVSNNMQQHLDTGKLKYFRTVEPKVFHRSHSRNLSFNLAEGLLLCNIDADNYTGPGFARFINDSFNEDPCIFLTPIDFHKWYRHHNPLPDVLGRVCFSRESFVMVKGFSESMSTHGFQDFDFANRLELAGNKRKIITNSAYLTAITHNDQERFSNESIKRDLHKILFKPINYFSSQVIFIYSSRVVDAGIIINNITKNSDHLKMAFMEKSHRYDFELQHLNWIRGNWEEADGIFTFGFDGSADPFFNPINSVGFEEVTDASLMDELIMFNTQLANRNIMHSNWDKKQVVTNNGAFGSGTVFKNFGYENPINL